MDGKFCNFKKRIYLNGLQGHYQGTMAALQGFQGHFWRPRLFLTGKLCQWASHFMPEECHQAEGQPCFLWGIHCWWSQPNRLKDHSKPMAMCSSISILTQKVFPKGVPSTIKHYMWITFLVSLLGPLFPHVSILRYWDFVKFTGLKITQVL